MKSGLVEKCNHVRARLVYYEEVRRSVKNFKLKSRLFELTTVGMADKMKKQSFKRKRFSKISKKKSLELVSFEG